ncbi:hypothetical protein I1A62_23080 [Rhodococcus sp. USK10]|uniref:4-hydroxybutyrate coenzyme A transferase n=1 Tax=Rhodococcus wratislaviensis TaxID=44752 RepID=A0A402CLU4_RHOWR|nr:MULTISPECIES: acetyl-CoA hydrolase/transferase C-terminal domain-containing protein [Rhodococcus]QYB07157.1 hypothetical protein I1A62_23080 [Rhodococcus sp. USK10]GCE44620.1 4-hydroxybutyrate coenzyme A transferase [Rhodococcus wratislaviensis]
MQIDVNDTHIAAARSLLHNHSHATVLAAMSPQQPDALIAALVRIARRDDVELTLVVADLSGQFTFLDDTAVADLRAGRLRVVSVAGAVPRQLSPHVDHLPNSLWDVDRLIATGKLRIDILVARVVQGEQWDLVSLGHMIGYTPTALEIAPRVGFEVSPLGSGAIAPYNTRLDRATAIAFSHSHEPTTATVSPPTDEQKKIADNVATLIPDGVTVQLGLGAVPTAVIRALRGKSDLGVHSGVIAGPLQDLIRSGVVTGGRKSRDPGRHLATGVLSQGVRDSGWGPSLRLAPISETHSPRTLLGQERLWAINSAFEIDLTGQVNAEYAGKIRIASGGGQTDFLRAAHISNGGGSVLALPARTRRGVSRIVAFTDPDHRVTSSGNDVDYVVTEFGVADLRGKSAFERARNLISIAHPDDRDELRGATAGVGCY